MSTARVMDACNSWLSGCIGSCQYPGVKSVAANASAPLTACSIVIICGIGRMFLTEAALTGRSSTVTRYIAGDFFGTTRGADTQSLRVTRFTSDNVSNSDTYWRRKWRFSGGYRRGFVVRGEHRLWFVNLTESPAQGSLHRSWLSRFFGTAELMLPTSPSNWQTAHYFWLPWFYHEGTSHILHPILHQCRTTQQCHHFSHGSSTPSAWKTPSITQEMQPSPPSVIDRIRRSAFFWIGLPLPLVGHACSTPTPPVWVIRAIGHWCVSLLPGISRS